MAKEIKKKSKAKFQRSGISFGKANYTLFGVSALTLFVGYWVLAQPPVDGFLSLTLAPILLVIGYCVLIPAAIMFTEKSKTQNAE